MEIDANWGKLLQIDNQYRPERRRREGRLRTLHDPMLAFLKSLEFLEILRLLKLENFITMARGKLGSATPPSVMALFFDDFPMLQRREMRT